MTFWGALNVVPIKIAARLTTMSWSVETDVPKAPVVERKDIVNSRNNLYTSSLASCISCSESKTLMRSKLCLILESYWQVRCICLNRARSSIDPLLLQVRAFPAGRGTQDLSVLLISQKGWHHYLTKAIYISHVLITKKSKQHYERRQL